MIEIPAKEIYMECEVCGQKHFNRLKAKKCCNTNYEEFTAEEKEILKMKKQY